MERNVRDPRIAALPDIHGHAKGEHKPFAEERPIPYTARMLFLWFFHACRRFSPRFVMVTDHMNYLTFEDPAAVNLVRRALKLAQAGDLYGAAETAGVELGHAAVVSEGLRKGMRYSIGAEVDNDPRSRPDAQNIVDAMKPDGMIRSVHFIAIAHPQHGENWLWAFDNPEFASLYEVVGTDTVWETYVTTLLDAIDKLPGNIVGHFYVPAKFGHWPDDAVLETYEDRLVDACAERGMAIEVNSRYFYKHYVDDEAARAKYRAVHLRLLRKAKAKGVMIAVGSDAHSPRDQGAAFDAVLSLLDEAEINEIAFPINGRLARVALRATEEVLRQQSAASTPAPAERVSPPPLVAHATPADDAAGDGDVSPVVPALAEAPPGASEPRRPSSKARAKPPREPAQGASAETRVPMPGEAPERAAPHQSETDPEHAEEQVARHASDRVATRVPEEAAVHGAAEAAAHVSEHVPVETPPPGLGETPERASKSTSIGDAVPHPPPKKRSHKKLVPASPLPVPDEEAGEGHLVSRSSGGDAPIESPGQPLAAASADARTARKSSPPAGAATARSGAARGTTARSATSGGASGTGVASKSEPGRSASPARPVAEGVKSAGRTKPKLSGLKPAAKKAALPTTRRSAVKRVAVKSAPAKPAPSSSARPAKAKAGSARPAAKAKAAKATAKKPAIKAAAKRTSVKRNAAAPGARAAKSGAKKTTAAKTGGKAAKRTISVKPSTKSSGTKKNAAKKAVAKKRNSRR